MHTKEDGVFSAASAVRVGCNPFSCGREQCIAWMGLCGNGVNSKWKMEEQDSMPPQFEELGAVDSPKNCRNIYTSHLEQCRHVWKLVLPVVWLGVHIYTSDLRQTTEVRGEVRTQAHSFLTPSFVLILQVPPEARHCGLQRNNQVPSPPSDHRDKMVDLPRVTVCTRRAEALQRRATCSREEAEKGTQRNVIHPLQGTRYPCSPAVQLKMAPELMRMSHV